MPCKAMQKFSVRYGIMLLCGWLPPMGAIAFESIATRGLVLVEYMLVTPGLEPSAALIGDVLFASGNSIACKLWLCEGS